MFIQANLPRYSAHISSDRCVHFHEQNQGKHFTGGVDLSCAPTLLGGFFRKGLTAKMQRRNGSAEQVLNQLPGLCNGKTLFEAGHFVADHNDVTTTVATVSAKRVTTVPLHSFA